MMRTQQTNPIHGRGDPSKETGPKTLLDFGVAFVRRQFLLLLLCIITAMGVAVGYLFITPASYTATATMLIDSRKGGIQQRSVLGDAPTDNVWIDSQMGILALERNAIGAAVATKLQLAKDPQFLESDGGLGGLAGWIRNEAKNRTAKSEAELNQR